MPSPHLGLMALGTFLKREGYDVLIEDYVINPYSRERAGKVAVIERPDYIGITAATMNINRALEIAGDYKNADAGIVTLAGGPHVTFDSVNILRNNRQIDYVVRGEGEITALGLLKTLEGKGNLEDVAGISWRKGSEIVENRDRPFISDINILPIPSLTLIEASKYRALGLPINMITSRGCPYRCIFCAGGKISGHKVRYYDVSRVVDEFENISRQGVSQINIADDLFTSSEERCIAICSEIVRRKIVHPWTAFARVDTVSERLLRSMKEAGCATLCFGIESATQGILDIIRKKITPGLCRRAVELCRDAGIEPMTSFIIGLPGETPETVERAFQFSRELSDKRGYHRLAPFPGTELRERAGYYGIRILSDNWDDYDANHAITESLTYPASEADRVVGEFNGSIQKYVDGLVHKRGRGEPLTGPEDDIVNRVRTFSFVARIITGGLLDTDNGRGGGGPIKDFRNFIEYLSGETGFMPSEASVEFERLVASGCVKVLNDETGFRVSWV